VHRDQEDHSLRPAWAKSLQDPISTNTKRSVVEVACKPSFKESVNRMITGGQPRQKHEILSEKYLKQKVLSVRIK
jgi:hypothetical protein